MFGPVLGMTNLMLSNRGLFVDSSSLGLMAWRASRGEGPLLWDCFRLVVVLVVTRLGLVRC